MKKAVIQVVKRNPFLVALFWAYVVICFWQLMSAPLNATVKHVYVVDRLTQIEREIPKDNPVQIPKGTQTIRIVYDIVRFFDGTAIIDRMIATPDNNEYIVNSVVKKLVKTSAKNPIHLMVNYEVPLEFMEGCGYRVFSSSTVTYDYNLLSFIYSPTYRSNNLSFCIGKP